MAADDDAIARLTAELADQFSFTDVSHPLPGTDDILSGRSTPTVRVDVPHEGVHLPSSTRSGVMATRTPSATVRRTSLGGDRRDSRGGVFGGVGGSVSGGSSAIRGVGGFVGGGGASIPPRPASSTSGTIGGGVALSAYGKRPDYFDKPVGIREPVKKSSIGKKICFGMVGRSGKVCFAQCTKNSNNCGVSSHRTKYVPAYEDAIYVPCRSRDSLGKPVAYFEPSIGRDELTPEFEVAFMGNGQGLPPIHTSYEWCVLIEDATKAHEKAEQELQGNYEDSDEDGGEGTHVLEELEEYESNFSMGDIPREVEYQAPLPKTDKGYNNALEETRVVLQGVVQRLYSIAEAIPLEGESVSQHLAPSVDNLIITMNRVVRSLRQVSLAVGDHDQLVRQGYSDVVDAILSKTSDGSLSHNQMVALKDLESKVEGFATVLQDIELDLQGLPTTNHVNAAILAGLKPFGVQITAMLSRLTQLENGGGFVGGTQPSHSGGGINITPPPSTSTTIPLNHWLVDAHGAPVMELSTLLAEHRQLVAKVASLEAAVSSEGGVVFGVHSFPSEKSLRSFMLKEAPHLKLDDFAAFCDACSLFCYDKEADDSSSSHQMLLKGGVDSPVTRRFISSFKSRYPPAYTGGTVMSEIESGSRIPCLATRNKWKGSDGNSGDREKIKVSIRSARDLGRQYCMDHLPSGPLRDLGRDMVENAAEFHGKLHNHFEDQMTTLIDSGLPEDQVLILLSSQFGLLFDRLYNARKKALEYTKTVDVWDWGVRSVWVALKAITLSEEATKDGLKQDSGMGISFVHFLTQQTGKKFNQMLGGGVDDVTKVAKAARDTANTAKAAAETAKKNAEGAHNKLDSLVELNPSLNKPKSPSRKPK